MYLRVVMFLAVQHDRPNPPDQSPVRNREFVRAVSLRAQVAMSRDADMLTNSGETHQPRSPAGAVVD